MSRYVNNEDQSFTLRRPLIHSVFDTMLGCYCGGSTLHKCQARASVE